jgi:cytochrome c-type protein NapB
MRKRSRLFGAGLVLAVLMIAASALLAQNAPPVSLPLRGPTPLDQIAPAQRMTPQRNTSQKESRNYPEQPPVIPHTIDGYQVDLNGNKCLSCHARSRTGESQAPMISITHFMDRDGQFLATISPRRFFCTQCHIPQHEVKAPVENDFVDVDTLLSRAQPGGARR